MKKTTVRPLLLFYEEPEFDRWVKWDRYPRRFLRRVIRGKPTIGGVQRWFHNLCAGLKSIGVEYDINQYRLLQEPSSRLAVVIGKSHVINKIPDHIPVVYGPGVDSHPCSNNFWGKKRIVHLLISCRWFRDMYREGLGESIPMTIWPAGIDTETWSPGEVKNKKRILVYDKVRWTRDRYETELITPVIDEVERNAYCPDLIRYGYYKEADYLDRLKSSVAMIFLCEHETQGFAYLQALSCNVPILAWDRGGYWEDPSYYPAVKFCPVSSVPYFDERCGMTFESIRDYQTLLRRFLQRVRDDNFSPRKYILENLTLEQQAREFVQIISEIEEELLSRSGRAKQS